MRTLILLVGPVAIFALLVGCGPTPQPQVPAILEDVPSYQVTGQILYEARKPTSTGTSRQTELRPARFVVVQFASAHGPSTTEATCDAEGRFAATVPVTTDRVLIPAHVQHEGDDLMVTVDREGTQPHVYEHAITEESRLRIVIADDAPGGPAGAFHILDTLLTGAEAVQRWVHETLPPFSAYWGRGVTTDWSYYNGACEDEEHFCVELLGGQPGQQATTDTDEHDEAIVLHEFGHFVMDRLSTSSSPGGNHSGEILIDPGLAWEEGRATWFAMSVLHAPIYQDTIGIEGQGSLRVNIDFEPTQLGGLHGIGSERGVAEILWDLTDGVDGWPDRDDDGVAMGPAAVLHAMMSLRDLPGAFPGIDTFLWALVHNAQLSEPSVKQVLYGGGHPASVLPASNAERWPQSIEAPGSVDGKIDGLSNPAPSGGPARPTNGIDAMRHYVVHVPRRGRLTAILGIRGTGRAEDHQDLDLELRDLRAELIADSRGTSLEESVSRVLEPGYYVLYVRDGGTGNRVGFHLSLRLD